MRCGRCQTDNLPDARFCTECGAPVSAGCAACGTVNAPTAKFCRRCGHAQSGVMVPPTDVSPPRQPRAAEPYTPPHLVEKVLTSRSALEGERKQVTVLFADVKGSLELAGQVDAEQWHRVLDRFFAILT